MSGDVIVLTTESGLLSRAALRYINLRRKEARLPLARHEEDDLNRVVTTLSAFSGIVILDMLMAHGQTFSRALK